MPTASRQILVAAAIGLVACASPAAAGDRALVDYIGYSHDLRYLAFEEHGVSDGVELAYSNIYVVDLRDGAFASGSPFRAEADENAEQPLQEIRGKAREAAEKALAALNIDTPVDIDALLGDGVSGPATELRFGLPLYGLVPATTEGDYTLSLETFDIPETACSGSLGNTLQGFALSLAGDGPARELHRDTTLEEWRGCPVGYRLYAVVTPHAGALSAGNRLGLSFRL